MRIYNNVSAMKASNILSKVNKSKTSNLEKLSSGLRINKASDDAAGLAISEKMRGQITGMKQAVRNSSDGQALLQTAEGAMSEINTIIQRMRELSVQAVSETYSQEERDNVMVELEQLNTEILRIAGAIKFNGKKLLAGDGAGNDFSLTLQVGANNDTAEQLVVNVLNVTTVNTTLKTSLDAITAATGNDAAVTTAFNNFLDDVSDELININKARSTVGAQVNRLDATINNLNSSIENLTDAESRIRDLDMASEMVEFTKNNILSQSSSAMVAAANKMPESILQLLQ